MGQGRDAEKGGKTYKDEDGDVNGDEHQYVIVPPGL